MRTKSGIAFLLLLALIVALAAALRIWGLGWGLPQEFHPDEPLVVPRAIGAVTNGDWNPHYFLVPSFQTELTSLAFYKIYLGGKVTGAFKNPDDFGQWSAWHYGTLYLVGRGISVLMGILVVIGAALLAGELLRGPSGIEKEKSSTATIQWGSLLAALMVAVSPLMTASSRFITPDMPMLAFCVWSIWVMLRAIRLGNLRQLVWAGLLAGFSVSSKYSAGVLLLPLIISVFSIRSGDAKKSPSRMSIILAALVAMLAGFLIGTPYAILDFPTFLNHLQIQYAAQHEGHIGMERAGATVLHMFGDMVTKEGPVLILMALIGAWALWTRNRRVWWVILPLIVVYLFEVSRWTVYADRYLLPALPFMMGLSALAVTAMVNRTKKPAVKIVTGIALVAILAIPPLLVTIQQARRLGLPDTRTAALAWVEANTPPGARILWEIGGPQPADMNSKYHREPSYDIITLPPSFSETAKGVVPLSILQETQPEYVITTSNYRARYESPYTQKRFPEIVEKWKRYYSVLDTEWDVAYDIRPKKEAGSIARTGPSIRIYKRKES